MKQKNNETWLPVTGYEGLYEVSDIGNVRSLPRYGTRTTEPTNISPHLWSGYLHVTLWKDGKARDHTVHRLVALAFIPNPENLPFINHKDEVRTNNIVGNLEWCTPKYNYNYSKVSEKVVKALGKEVVAYDRRGAVLGIFESIRKASRVLGISITPIRASLLHGKQNKYGYKFTYK